MDTHVTRVALIGNGMSVHLQQWIHDLRGRGFQILLITDRPPKHLDHEVKLFPLSSTAKSFTMMHTAYIIMKNILNVRKILQTNNPDIVHCHFTNHYGWVGSLSGKRPVIQTIWGSDLMQTDRWPDMTLNRLAWRSAYAITIHSEYMHKRLQLELPKRFHKNIRVVRWGLDVRKYANIASRDSARATLKFTGPTIFSPRSIAPVYQTELLVHALPRVIERFPNLTAIFSLYNHNPGYLNTIREQIRNLRIEDNVSFVENIPPDIMPMYYRGADVTVSLAKSEGFPISLLEALMSGTKILVADIPQLKELAGVKIVRFVDVNRRENIENAILDSLSSSPNADQILQGKLFAQRWSAKEGMKEMTLIYAEAIDTARL